MVPVIKPTSSWVLVGFVTAEPQWELCINDAALLWLWCRPAATAPIQPLAWEPPYAEGAALGGEKKIVYCFVQYGHFNNINSSNPGSWDFSKEQAERQAEVCYRVSQL